MTGQCIHFWYRRKRQRRLWMIRGAEDRGAIARRDVLWHIAGLTTLDRAVIFWTYEYCPNGSYLGSAHRWCEIFPRKLT